VSSWLPDPFFRLYTDRIHKDKHGSDSGTYDIEGRFVPRKFEDIFAKYAGGDKQGITLGEVFEYMKGQRFILDLSGWGGAFFECE
jgi:peroxygenase